MKKFEDSEFYKNTSRQLKGRKIDLEKETREVDSEMDEINENYYRMKSSSILSSKGVYVI